MLKKLDEFQIGKTGLIKKVEGEGRLRRSDQETDELRHYVIAVDCRPKALSKTNYHLKEME